VYSSPHMVRPLQIFAVFYALLVGASLATPVGAVPDPDSAQRAALQERVGHLDRVRILGPGGTTLLLKPVVREDGLHMRGLWKPPRAALFVSADAPAPPRPVEFVPWGAIERVQVHRSATRSGALTGAVIGGFVVGLTLLASRRQVSEEWKQADIWIMAGSALVIGGTTLTGLVLGTFAEEWTPVYPPSVSGARR
jgi:hypothetical protein